MLLRLLTIMAPAPLTGCDRRLRSSLGYDCSRRAYRLYWGLNNASRAMQELQRQTYPDAAAARAELEAYWLPFSGNRQLPGQERAESQPDVGAGPALSWRGIQAR